MASSSKHKDLGGWNTRKAFLAAYRANQINQVWVRIKAPPLNWEPPPGYDYEKGVVVR